MKKWYQEGTKMYVETALGMRIPYTVSGDRTGGKLRATRAKLVFKGPIYFDSFPERIEDDPNGDVLEMSWSEKRQEWKPVGDRYSWCVFGEHSYYPNMD